MLVAKWLARPWEAELISILGLATCRFDYGTGLGVPRLHRDGRVVGRHQLSNAVTDGLPPNTELELLVQSAGSFRGRFLLTAPPFTSRP